MTLKELLYSDNSKLVWEQVAKRVVDSPDELAELFSYFEDTDVRLVQRATQAMGKVQDMNKDVLKPYYVKMIHGLAENRIDAYKRNVMRIFQTAEIPEAYEGHLFDYAFTFLENKNEPVAIKAFSMTVLRRIASKHPDLIPEVIEVIEFCLEESESAGIQNRGGHELSKLREIVAKTS